MSFALDPRLAGDSHLLADGPLCQWRVMDDQRFAWLVLVPRIADASEWIDLDAAMQWALQQEVATAGHWLRAAWPCDKLNIGALGNIVRQLHVHVVARVAGDAAWPGPVWGAGKAVRVPEADRGRWLEDWRSRLPPGLQRG